jgi:hypothetical protein
MCVCVEISPRTPPFSPRARLLLPPALPAASSPCLALATSMALDHDQPVKVRPDLLSPRAPTSYRRAAACYGFTGAPSSACQPGVVSVERYKKFPDVWPQLGVDEQASHYITIN